MTNVEVEVRNATKEAFGDLVERYYGLAYRVAFRMLRNVEDAEDAVQDAFISAYRAFPRFRGASKVSTWLYRIVVNACLMKIRKETNRGKYVTQTSSDDYVFQDPEIGPERAAINSELLELIVFALEKLVPKLRTAVVLRDVQGLSYKETAETLEVTVSTLKSRLRRARRLLRENLKGYLAIPDLEGHPNLGLTGVPI